ncbi:hypothetical protein [Chryseobacterium sp.]|uniref:phosphoribosyltransferase-like protein n=1 Tax=Chryseobacterium sp. TaxID=1871047 RepID=UPI0012AA65D1|nr:hypothetical protein [Chryseobacterium sp.]QFG52029.1 hypothetical protein F7R58_00070 [Chryseobacterium sp.]
MAEENIDKYYYKLKIFSETVWEHKISKNKIDIWLSNFKEEERENLLFLLTQFIYFSKLQIDNMLISIYRDFYKYVIVENYRLSNNNTTDIVSIKNHFKESERKSRFIPIGNPSESSSSLLGEFRKINNIRKDLFIERSELLNFTLGDIEHFIFIDDICGSGHQAYHENQAYISHIRTKFPNSKIHYYSLVGLEEGLEFLNGNNQYDFLESVLRLDKTYKCFSSESRIFKNNEDNIKQDDLKQICESYGLQLYESIVIRQGGNPYYAAPHKLGYNDSQLLIGFHHNTPDNTLPIIWYNEDMITWNPIFPRANKVY